MSTARAGLFAVLIVAFVLAVWGVRCCFILPGKSTPATHATHSAVPPTPTGLSTAPLPKSFTNSIGIKLVLIPTGKFTMGSPASEEDRNSNEGPQHEVEITRSFNMGVHEVTQEEYQKVMGTNPSYFKGLLGHRRLPVESVSWNDAVQFCRKLTENENHERGASATRVMYRLPTEAEWEYACRAGTTTPFHYGGALSSRQANFDGTYPYAGAAKGPYLRWPTPVGSYEPNALGLYDMHGNVFEWCQDWYADDYKGSPRQDPLGPQTGQYRVLRGGSFGALGWVCRAACRLGRPPDERSDNVGFRVCCVDLPQD